MSGDASDFFELARVFESAGPKALENVKKAVSRSAFAAKKFWQSDADRTGLEQYAAAVDYDIVEVQMFGGATVEARIGPNLDRGVGLPSFGFVEEAPGGVRSAPQFAGRAAIESVAEDLERGLMIALEEAGE